MIDIKTFRNAMAEDGQEMTINEAQDMLSGYETLLGCVKEAFVTSPDFYKDIRDRSPENKLDDITRLNAKVKEKDPNGKEMTMAEYDELQDIIVKICELEGFHND